MDLWWCVAIYEDLWWFVGIYEDLWWFVAIYEDLWWCVGIYEDVWWFMVILMLFGGGLPMEDVFSWGFMSPKAVGIMITTCDYINDGITNYRLHMPKILGISHGGWVILSPKLHKHHPTTRFLSLYLHPIRHQISWLQGVPWHGNSSCYLATLQ